ncbi:MAG: transposase [Verrucomicrobiia bacterium]
MLPKRHAPAHPNAVRLRDRSTIIFVTICTKERKPILANDVAMNLLLKKWRRADEWLVGRFVIMPDHVHLFCAPARLDSCELRAWTTFWKTLVSRSWPQRDQLSLWQQNFWDRQLRRQEGYAGKSEYVRQKPVRHGLVTRPEDWPYQGELNVLLW